MFPINRSITGVGVRQTINFIKKNINKKFKNKNKKVGQKYLIGKYNEGVTEAYIENQTELRFMILKIITCICWVILKSK